MQGAAPAEPDALRVFIGKPLACLLQRAEHERDAIHHASAELPVEVSRLLIGHVATDLEQSVSRRACHI